MTETRKIQMSGFFFFFGGGGGFEFGGGHYLRWKSQS